MRAIPAPRPPDLALASLLLMWWLAESGGVGGAGIVSLLLMTAPLGWRRVAPLAVVGLVAAGFAAGGLEPDPPEPLAQLVAILVATAGVAVLAATWRRARVGGLLALAGGAAEALLQGQDLGFILILTGAAWAGGAAVRRLSGRTDLLEARALELDERVRTAAAEERERIARELHDVISHSVSLMVVQAGAAEQVLRSDVAQAERALGAVQLAGRHAIDDLRRMLGLLRAGDTGSDGHPRSPPPGLAALDDLLTTHADPVEIERAELPTLPAGIDLAAFRIIQEALTNARRHAPGGLTRIRVDHDRGLLVLDIRTASPAGRTPRASAGPAGGGHGIAGMRERASLYGGTCEAGPDGEAGWFVHATLPTGAAR